MLKSLALPLFILASLLLTACDGHNPNIQLGGDDKPSHVVLPKNDLARLEMPALKKDAHEIFVVHRTAPVRTSGDSVLNYAYAYDTSLYHTRWVAFRFDGDTRPRNVTRKAHIIRPQYPRDPKLPVQYALYVVKGGTIYEPNVLRPTASIRAKPTIKRSTSPT